MKTKFIYTFKELSRQNTGCHPMDSGGATGRHWQRKLPPEGAYIESAKMFKYKDGREEPEVYAYIPQHVFLESLIDVDKKLTRAIQSRDRKEGLGIFDVEDFMKSHANFKFANVGYTYNYENDLSQNFQYVVLSEREDWYYDDSAIVVIQSHNGADARGGFSTYIVGRFKDDYAASIFMEPVLHWGITKAPKAKLAALEKLTETWEPGWSSFPTGMMLKDIKRILHKSRKDPSAMRVELKDGTKCTVYCASRALEGW